MCKIMVQVESPINSLLHYDNDFLTERALWLYCSFKITIRGILLEK